MSAVTSQENDPTMRALREHFDGVVFDLDGTLVETAPDLAAALNHTLAWAGYAAIEPERVRPMIGDGAAAMLRRGLAAQQVELDDAALRPLLDTYMAYYIEHLADSSRPFPGLVDQLDALKTAGFRLGVCTNKAILFTDKLLAALDLTKYFDAVLGGDSLDVRKPDPEHLLATLRRMRCAPGRAVMLGDSNNDVQAARNAGVKMLLVSFGYTAIPVAELDRDALIDDFSGLPWALASLA
jgi:phosphoglycolate phosphatase